MTTTPLAASLAASLAAAVADRTLDRLGRHLTEDVVLRALLPGGVVEERGREAVVARYERWFGDYDTVDLLDSSSDMVGDVLLVHYKLRFDPDGDRRVLTQTLVCRIDDDRVRRMDLVCSGFRAY